MTAAAKLLLSGGDVLVFPGPQGPGTRWMRLAWLPVATSVSAQQAELAICAPPLPAAPSEARQQVAASVLGLAWLPVATGSTIGAPYAPPLPATASQVGRDSKLSLRRWTEQQAAP